MLPQAKYSFIDIIKIIFSKIVPNKLRKYVFVHTSTYPKYVKLQIFCHNYQNSFIGHSLSHTGENTIKTVVIKNTPEELHKNVEISNYIKCLSMYRGYSVNDNYNEYLNTFRFAINSAYHCLGPGMMAVIHVKPATENEVLLFGEE